MSAKFYTLLTEIGAAKLASAAALGVPLKITHMAVGDGGGVLPTPSAQQTALVAERRRAALNMLYIDPQNNSQIIAEQVIPETEGGWWIREVGLFDETGALIAVGNCPESYKPQLTEGSGRTQTVRMVLITSSTDNITMKIDPAVVLATRKYVDDKELELKVYVDDLMAKHLAAPDPHSQYAQKDSPTLTGIPKVPTPAAGNSTKQIANTEFVASSIAAMVDSAPAALDTLNELAAALGNDPNFATTMINALAGKQPLDNTLTNLSGKDIAGLLTYLGLGETAKQAAGAVQKTGDEMSGKLTLPQTSSFGVNTNNTLGGSSIAIGDNDTRTGSVLRLLISGPLALLRVALFAVGSLLGALLSPVGLVVAALAGVALVIWKYWQPISAFLGGVVEGFKAAAAPISAAFEPLRPVFQWIGDRVQALWGWFNDLLTPVKSTSEELNSAAAMGRRFGEALAEGLNMVMHPLESLKSGVSWLLEKLGIVSKEAAKAKLPAQVTQQQSATVNSDGKVVLPPGGFPAYAGMYDTGGIIPRGQFGIVGENGPEIVNGPANVTSRRRTAALASVVAGVMGVAATPAEVAPLHPFSLPARTYQTQPVKADSPPSVIRYEINAPIHIVAQPGQSAQDIAREVARQLDERERRARAKARSNFSDQGGYES
ncbi:phage tail protein [Salmonella enterica]